MEEYFFEVIQRIKDLNKLQHDDQVGKLLNIKKSNFSDYKKRKVLPFKKIIEYCDKNNLSLDLLFRGTLRHGEMFISPDRENIFIGEPTSNQIYKLPIDLQKDFYFIPQVEGKISAGKGLIPDNTIEITVGFRKDWINRKGDPKQMSLIRVRGDSMEPTLYSGDLVLIDHNRKHVDPQGGIYAITVGEDIMLKRLHLIHPVEKIKILSDNSKYEPIEAGMDDIVINGKVIWFARELER